MAWDKCRSRCKENKQRKRRLGQETSFRAMKRVHSNVRGSLEDRGSQFGEDVRETLKQLNEDVTQMRRQLNSLYLSPQSILSYTDPSEYGHKVRSELPPPDVSIIPWPLTVQAADSILPSYETCLGKEAGQRILEKDFKEWMTHINLDKCKFAIHFTGNEYIMGKTTKYPDFSIVLKGKPIIPVFTGALLFLLSHDGKFNAPRKVGEAIGRAKSLIHNWRSTVIVGVTDGILVEWFVVQEKERAAVGPVYAFRESLCGLLAADPSTLYLTPCDLEGVAIKTQLGIGRTSSVYKADWQGQEVAVKWYRKEFEFALEHEAQMLRQLKGIQGIPTLVHKNAAHRYLLMTPIGESLASSEAYMRLASVFMHLVEILQSVHKKGVIHRDIRPPNILLVTKEPDTEPRVVLIDWGFAANAGEKTIFSGAVETGSDNLFKQLLQAHSECMSVYGSARKAKHATTSVGGDGASERVLTRGKSKLAEMLVEGDGASISEGMLTRGKSKLAEMTVGGDGEGVLTRGKSKLAEMTIGGDGAFVSEEVLTRRKSKLAETNGVYCTLFPADDLVSLFRTFLLLTNNAIKEQVKRIPRDDYEIYLSMWQSIMTERPRLKKVQDSAEHGDYERVLEFLGEAATFME